MNTLGKLKALIIYFWSGTNRATIRSCTSVNKIDSIIPDMHSAAKVSDISFNQIVIRAVKIVYNCEGNDTPYE